MDIPYQQQQQQLMDLIEWQFQNGKTPSTIVEPVSDYANDPRMYLTAIVYLPPTIQQTISKQLIQPLEKIFPNEYFIEPETLHLTVLSIRLFEKGEFFDTATLEKIKAVFAQIIPQHKSITFKLKGLLRLPTSLGMRCYCTADFGILVKHLQNELKSIDIITDKKLASNEVFFSNVTICRFAKRAVATQVATVTQQFDTINLGTVTPSKISLVIANAATHPRSTKTVGEYYLS